MKKKEIKKIALILVAICGLSAAVFGTTSAAASTAVQFEARYLPAHLRSTIVFQVSAFIEGEVELETYMPFTGSGTTSYTKQSSTVELPVERGRTWETLKTWSLGTEKTEYGCNLVFTATGTALPSPGTMGISCPQEVKEGLTRRGLRWTGGGCTVFWPEQTVPGVTFNNRNAENGIEEAIGMLNITGFDYEFKCGSEPWSGIYTNGTLKTTAIYDHFWIEGEKSPQVTDPVQVDPVG